MNLKPAFASIGLSLALCIACGGSSDGGGANVAGGSGSGNPASAGNGNSSGSGQGGAPGGGGSNLGGASNSGSGGYSSGLPGDKQLGSLTDDEAAALCKKISDYFSDTGPVGKSVEEFTCRFSSALTALFTGPQTDAALQTTCKSMYATCIAGDKTSSETCKKPDATCTATVAEYDACMNDQLKAFMQLGAAFPSCDEITLASASTLLTGNGTETPASCKAIEEKCPTAPAPPGFGGSDSDPNP